MTIEQEIKLFEFVSTMHGKQKYCGAPYVTHLFQTVQVLKSEAIERDDYIIAAYCHDLLEDTEITENELEKSLMEIGFLEEDVKRAIQIVSNLTVFPKKYGEQLHIFSKQRYRMAISHDKDSMIIKLCDRVVNLQSSIANHSTGHIKKYLREHSEYFEKFIFRIMRHNGDDFLLEILSWRYQNLINFMVKMTEPSES